VFDYQPQPAKKSWAQETFNFPGGTPTGGRSGDGDITGSVSAKKEEPKPVVAAPEAAKPSAAALAAAAAANEPTAQVSASERAILERLQARRQELETRAREIDIRESLLKAAEKRIESRVDELKGVEAGIKSATEQKGEADSARFKGIITMYEGMKPKDAAKIFDRLEMPVLFEIASQIAPRKMSDILGLMQPEAAERLTVELARRANGGDRSASAADLPKIEGRPLPQGRN
jgi:flagellar motility protein MotE (MotC chaperone)